MKNLRLVFLALLSGLMLSLPWYSSFSGILLLVAFVPLLFIEYYFTVTKNQNKLRLFILINLTFFSWNLLTCWWIMNASFFGAMLAIIINTFLMSVVFWIYHLLTLKSNPVIKYILFIVIWLSFEFLYFRTEISWPWLTLGNGFGKDIKLIQWYEYSGVLGGSLWVLIANVLFFDFLKYFLSVYNKKKLFIKFGITILFIITPMIFSILIYSSFKEKGKPYSVAILQPNIDPYSEYTENFDSSIKLKLFKEFTDRLKDTSADFLLCPEAYIAPGINEKLIESNHFIIEIKKYLTINPRLTLISGLKSYKIYNSTTQIPNTARPIYGSNAYIDYFNSVVCIQSDTLSQVRHKSRLVLGVEKLPYPGCFKWLEKLSEKAGGVSQSLGEDIDSKIFNVKYKKVKVASIICYESTYGEFVNEFVKKGASLIFLSTNDGWWGDTPGHLQHLSYSQILAIEARRPVIRSANTGVSAFINQRGEIINRIDYNKKNIICSNILSNNQLTIYSKNGDLLGRISMVILTILILYIFWTKLRSRSKKEGNKIIT